MSYKALYRTYRPTTFSEVAGQKAIVRTLENALKQNKMAHAYLFSGPRGTGKTSMAKLFAKALNCEEGIGHQCNKCTNCLGVNEGSHPDVYEIDAASNNGVDDVRQLIENINYAPIRGRYKVYIIDEVHMMTPSAFNALLKTLEEPPRNVIFILATTEPHKVLPTILSRCQRYNFSKVSDSDISERLKTVLVKENIVYEEEALSLLVSLADGGVRDALSMLDQVVAYADRRLRLNDVLALFALTSKLEQLNLLSAITRGDMESVFTILNSLLDKGVDIRRLTIDLLNILKDVLIYNKTQNINLLHFLRENEVSILKDLAPSDLSMMIDNFLKAQNDYRFASDIKNIFEITILKIIALLGKEEVKVVTPVKETPLPKIEPKKVEPAPLPSKPVESAPVVTEPIELPPFLEEAPKPVTKQAETPVEKEMPVEKPVVKKKVLHSTMLKEGTEIVLEDDLLIKILTLADRDEKMKLKNEAWDELALLSMEEERGEYAALLFEGTPYALSSEVLVMEFQFARQVKLVNLKENQALIQNVLSDLLGRKIPVYALTSEASLKLTKKYRSMSQVRQLPKVKSVSEELEGKF